MMALIELRIRFGLPTRIPIHSVWPADIDLVEPGFHVLVEPGFHVEMEETAFLNEFEHDPVMFVEYLGEQGNLVNGLLDADARRDRCRQ